METDLKAQLLQEMAGHPAWQLFQAHLDRLCRQKEQVKSEALRRNQAFEAMKEQFEIDGITLAVKSLTKLIASLSQQTENPQGD